MQPKTTGGDLESKYEIGVKDAILWVKGKDLQFWLK